MKQIDLKPLFMLGLLFLFINCQKDDPEIDNIETEAIENIAPHDVVKDDPGIKRIAFRDIISDDRFSKLALKYDIAQFYDFTTNKGVNTFSIENTASNSNDVVIVTDTVNVITRENYTSYTLLIKTNDGTVKNLLLEEGENGDNAFILTYDIEYTYTAEGREFDRGTMYMEPFTGNVQVENSIENTTTNASGQTCRWIKATEWIQCACGHWTRPPCKGCDGGWPRFPEQREYWVEICSNFGGGGIGEIFTTENTDEYPSGGGSPSSGPSGGPSSETALISSSTDDFLIGFLVSTLQLNPAQEAFLRNNIDFASDLKDFLDANSLQRDLAQTFAKDLVESSTFGLPIDLDDYDLRYIVLRETYFIPEAQQLPNYLQQPEDPFLGQAFGIDIIHAALDGISNILLWHLELGLSDRLEGQVLRKIMRSMGVDVPADIDDETLGELFKLRRHRLNLTIVYESGFLGNLLELGISTLDVFALLSPSKGAGAFLAINTNKVTAKLLSDYLNALRKGEWITTNESMSQAAAAYQSFISGKPFNVSFKLNNVKFDGIRKAFLVDAKSGMLNFVNDNGTFKPFFTGQDAIINQARRQIEASNGLPIEWHFQHENVRIAYKNLIEGAGLMGIKFIHTPN